MITDLFFKRCIVSDFDKVPNTLFVQFLNLIKEHYKVINLKAEEYKYTTDYSDEFIRIIYESQNKFCNERGFRSIDKHEYKDVAIYSICGRIFENFTYDELVNLIDKLSLFELVFREAEEHLIREIKYLEEQIPKYEIQSDLLKERMEKENRVYYNVDEEKWKNAKELLDIKNKALQSIRQEIKDRLKLHRIPLTYYNGYFLKNSDPLIEEKIITPFWELLSDPKYKNIEIDMLTALDLFQQRGRDPAFYAAKALESMIKIVCKEKKIKKETDKTPKAYITTLYENKIILNHEQDELTSLFRIRNSHGHGPGDETMPQLTIEQEYRYIHSCMLWIYSLWQR